MTGALSAAARREHYASRVGAILKRERIRAGLLSTGLAMTVGTNPSTISGIENAGRIPRLDTIIALLRATGAGPEVFAELVSAHAEFYPQ